MTGPVECYFDVKASFFILTLSNVDPVDTSSHSQSSSSAAITTDGKKNITEMFISRP